MKIFSFLKNNLCKNASLFLLFSTFLLSQNSISQQLAFPTASGAAAYVSGGRGGSVSVVTNLKDSGPGSLRSYAKISNTTIVFNISGIINLKSPLNLYGHNVTIAGQTAPEGGITIEGSTVLFQTNKNLIVRHLRFRGGYHNGDIDDSITGHNLVDAIFDHCSISYGGDEAISMAIGEKYLGGNITVQNCLIAESKTGSIMGSEVAQDNLGDLSMIGNVYYNITHRFPNIVGNTRFDIINNYVHNAKFRLINGKGGYKLNQLNNFYDFGNNDEVFVHDPTMNMHTCMKGDPIPAIYTNGNVILGEQRFTRFLTVTSTIAQVNADNNLSWKYFYDNSSCGGSGKKNKGDQVESNFFRDTQYPILGKRPTIHKAGELKNMLVPHTGATKRLNSDGSVSDNHDVLDSDWKRNIMEGNYIPSMKQSKYATPAITSVVRPKDYDSDNDGMPDVWEMMMFGTLNHDGTKNSNGNGYTDLEEFLNQVDSRTAINVPVEQIEVSPNSARLQLKNTLQVTSTFTPRNTTDKNGTWSSSNTAIATVDGKGLVTPVSVGDGKVHVGDVYITYTSGDGRIKGTSKITVFAPPVLVYAGDDQEICNGGNTTLTATGGSSYLWNTGERTASIRIGPSTSRTYTVTGYDTTGKFSDKDEVNLIVSKGLEVSAGNDVTIYSGESTSLTATGATTYEWSNGATLKSINVSPKTTTTYTVTGTKSGCGKSSDNVTVSVITKPANVKANGGGDQSIVLGIGTTLMASGGASYLWNTGDETADLWINPTTSRKYTVTVYDSTGKHSNTDEVYVTIIPVSAGKNVTINAGDSTTLVASNAYTYKWSTGSTSESVTVSPEKTTTYTVKGTTNSYESTDTVTVTVVAKFDHKIGVVANGGGDQSIVLGVGTTLMASGGASYLWNTGDRTAELWINPTTSRKYTVTVYDSTGKHTDTDEVYVTINPVSAGKNVMINSGESTTLMASNAYTYQWSTGGTSESVTVSPLKTTTYTVTGRTNRYESTDNITVTVLTRAASRAEMIPNDGGNKSIDAVFGTTLKPKTSDIIGRLDTLGFTKLGKLTVLTPYSGNINDVENLEILDLDPDKATLNVDNYKQTFRNQTNLEFLIHPNPTEGELYIRVSGMSNLSSIILYDLSGKSLYTENIKENNQIYIKTLDLSSYKSGIYILQLVDNHKVITKKVILK